MTTHVYHEGLPMYRATAVLQDGCPECEERAKSIGGLLHLDPERRSYLWRVMLIREGKLDGVYPSGLSGLDAAATDLMYRVAVFIERMGIGDPWRCW